MNVVVIVIRMRFRTRFLYPKPHSNCNYEPLPNFTGGRSGARYVSTISDTAKHGRLLNIVVLF